MVVRFDDLQFIRDFDYCQAMDKLALKLMKKEDNVISITSMQKHEAIFNVGINLAYSLNKLNNKICVVYADFHNECYLLHDKLSNTFTLNDPALRERNYSDGLNNIDGTNIDIIFPSSFSSPLTTLSSGLFDEMINFLRNKYDFILLIAPPISKFVDGYLIGHKSESLILLIEEEMNTVSGIKNILLELNYQEIDVMGFVLVNA